jgi:hypothetical protein
MDETDSQAQDQTKELDPEGLLDQQDEEEEDGVTGDSSHISEKMCEQALASATEASGSDYESEGTDTEMDQEEGEPTGALPAGKIIFGSGTDQNIPGEKPDGSATTRTDGDALPAEQANDAAAAAATVAAAAAAAAVAAELAKKGECNPSNSTGKKIINSAEIVQRFKVPSMVPKPMIDSGLKKKVEEPDVIPTDSYRKIRESLKKVNILPTIGGTGSGSVADESVGSFYNPGDNRIARSIIKEDSNALFTTSKSFDSNNWDCFACPVKHSVLGGGAGGTGGPSRPVIIICDQNFPAILPSATGECAAIARLEDATFEELGDFLSSFAAKDSLPHGTLILVGSLSELKRGGISPYLAACTQMIRRLGNRFGDGVTVIPFVPPPMGGTKDLFGT